MQVSSSVKAALLIALLILIYFGARGLFRAEEEAVGQTAPSETLFSVVATPIEPAAWRDEVTVRGRTEAIRKVSVRSETAGAVAETPAAQGSKVKKGDVLCRLNTDARQAALREAQARLTKARLDYDASRKLAAEGFRSETAVAAEKAALDQAIANLELAELNLSRVRIVAPFDGIFDRRQVEVGDFMNVGAECGVVIQQDPFLVTGAVSEQVVGKIKKGDRGVARLSTGEEVEGVVRFVAASADPVTRTFRVEMETPNVEGSLKDGVTAEFVVFTSRRDAHHAPRSALGLDEEGKLAVRIVENNETIRVRPVRLLGEDATGVWLDGLDGSVALVTVGQDYVSDGQKVRVAASTAPQARPRPTDGGDSE